MSEIPEGCGTVEVIEYRQGNQYLHPGTSHLGIIPQSTRSQAWNRTSAYLLGTKLQMLDHVLGNTGTHRPGCSIRNAD